MLPQGWGAVAWPWSSSLGMANFPLTLGLGHCEFGAASKEGNLAGSSDLWSSNGPPFPPAPPACSAVGFQGEIQEVFPLRGGFEGASGWRGGQSTAGVSDVQRLHVGSDRRDPPLPTGITAQPCARQQLTKCGRGRSPALRLGKQQSQEDVSSSPKSCGDQIMLSCSPATTPIPAWSCWQSVLMYLVAFVELTHCRGQT